MKKYNILIICCVLLLFIIGAASAADNELGDTNSSDVLSTDDAVQNTHEIYVNDTGKDSNTGSVSSPYHSISRSLSDVKSDENTTIHMRGIFGFENNTDFTFDFNHQLDGGSLTFVGDDVETTIIDANSIFNFATIKGQSNITFKNLTFLNFKGSTTAFISVSDYATVTIDNCIFKDGYVTTSSGAYIYATSSSTTSTYNQLILNFILFVHFMHKPV